MKHTKYSMMKHIKLFEDFLNEAEDVKKDIHDHWQEVYGKDFIAEHPSIAKILKNRKNLDLREFERIWNESYEEDFKEAHPNIWNKMNKS
jgi:hypothetical protein